MQMQVLVGGDIRAIERTYNLLQQVGGRAGRSKQSGKCFHSNILSRISRLYKSLKNRNRKEFIEQSLLEREKI